MISEDTLLELEEELQHTIWDIVSLNEIRRNDEDFVAL